MLAPFTSNLPEPSRVSESIYQACLEQLAAMPSQMLPKLKRWLRTDVYGDKRWQDLIKVQMDSTFWEQMDLATGYWLLQEARYCSRAIGDAEFNPSYFIQAFDLFHSIRHRRTTGGSEELLIGSKLWHDAVIGGLNHAGAIAMDEITYEQVLFSSEEQAQRFVAMTKQLAGEAAAAGLMAVQQYLRPTEPW
jgi:hypothetical protein